MLGRDDVSCFFQKRKNKIRQKKQAKDKFTKKKESKPNAVEMSYEWQMSFSFNDLVPWQFKYENWKKEKETSPWPRPCHTTNVCPTCKPFI